LSRVINHLLKDIASLTRYHPDTSSRLCFLLGARKAIHLMLAVRDAPNYKFMILNSTAKEKGIEQVKNKVTKDLNKQGYKFELRNEFGNVIAIAITDRKKISRNVSSAEDLVNKYEFDQIKHKGYPQVILRRKASIDASMGENIESGDISGIPPVSSGDEVVLMDMYYNIVGYGISQMSSEEIKRSPGRIAIRTIEGRYEVPKFHENKYYRNGLFSITTLPRILGLKVLEFNDKPAVILNICQDDGEISVELLNRAAPGSKVYLITRNENHRKAIKSTFERLQVDTANFEMIQVTLDKFTKSRPREKFTHVFLEMHSTESGLRPNPYFDQEEKNVISNARAQFSALRGVALVGSEDCQISYVTHSIDPSENQEVVVQAFRQTNFKPVELDETLLEEYAFPLNALPEIPTVTQTGTIDLDKFDNEKIFEKSWLQIDPIIHQSDAGFVAKIMFNH